MNPLDQNFKGQLTGESVVCVFRRHWIAVFNTLLSLLGLFIALFILFLNLPKLLGETGYWSLVLGCAFLALHALIHRQFLIIFRYFLSTVVITDHRVVVVDKSVFFKDSKNSIDLATIQDIQKTQNGFFENFFNYGSLVFVLSGSSETTTIDLVPRPDYQYKKINQMKANIALHNAPHAEMAG